MCVKICRSGNQYELAIAAGVSLIDFGAPWCAPCRSQEPILEKLAERYGERATIAALNVDDHPDLAAKLDIKSIPTLIVYTNQKEIQRFVGLQSEHTLAEALDKALN